MHLLFPLFKTLFLILLCLYPLGCATSPPTKFYLLSPLPPPESEAGMTYSQEPITIRVDAVTISGYLDRPEIVTRVSENEIHLADLNQWGESLRDNLTCVLALNLSRLLPADRFAVFPFKCPTTVDYQVSVEIVQMDGNPGGEVHLMAQWSILKGKDSQIVATRKSRFNKSNVMPGYGALVSAQSRLVEALSHEIAEGIQGRR